MPETDQSNEVTYELRNGAAYLTLSRPEVLNAFNHQQRVSLAEQLERAEADPEVRVVVLQGAGRAFCAGQDQKESAGFDETTAARRLETYTHVFNLLRASKKPSVAKLHGYAAGAGFQLALMADIRVSSPDTKLGMTELRIGSPPIIGSAMLRPIIGDALTRWMVLTADFIDAEQAAKWGIVHEVVAADRLTPRVEELVARLAGWDPGPVARTKAWLHSMGEEFFTHAVAQAKTIHDENFRTGSLSKGAKAFVARKRV